MIVLVGIRILIRVVLFRFLVDKIPTRRYLEGQVLEWVWTFIPGVVLIFIALPSIRLIYMYDELVNFEFSIKCLGQQWFWSYEYPKVRREGKIIYDSYIVPMEDLNLRGFRLLEVNNALVIPVGVVVQLLVTSEDVLHSWALPRLGLKIDSIPGRVNSLLINCFHSGVYYGQCSEICGAYHRFIPIKMEVINSKNFLIWLIR